MKKSFKISSMVVISLILVTSVSTAVAAKLNGYSTDEKVNKFSPANVEISVRESGGELETGESNTNPVLENSFKWKEATDCSTYSADKTVSVYSNSDAENPIPVFVRVCIIPRWTTTVSGSQKVESVETETSETTTTVSYAVDVFKAKITDTGLNDDDSDNNSLKDFGSLTSINISDNKYTIGDVTFNLSENWSDYWIFNEKDGYFYYKTALQPGKETENLLESVSISSEVYEKINSNGISLEVDVLADSIQTEGNDELETNALEERWNDSKVKVTEVTKNSSEKLQLITEATTKNNNDEE